MKIITINKSIFFYLLLILSFSENLLGKQIDDKCSWKNKNSIPCLIINKSSPNSNYLSTEINPTIIITKKEIEKYNLIDLTKVINFANGSSVIQSGPTGQQTSVFMRGTNSNHVLVLLNGIPINDQSTPNGVFDFGQDFMTNVTLVEIYKSSSGAHFGADSIGGAVNLITAVDYKNKLSTHGRKNYRNIGGNYTNNINDWQINFQGGLHKSKTESALKQGTDKDGTKNKSLGINVAKWLNDKIKFRTNFFFRNNFTDLDGHSLPLQEGYESDNKMYALQIGADHTTKNVKNYITLHTHNYNRDYSSPGGEIDEYNSESFLLRAEHSKVNFKKFTYGLGFDYKNDNATFTNRGSYNSSLSGDYDNLGFFTNFGYQLSNNLLTSLNLRSDKNYVVGENNSYKLGFLKKNLLSNLNLRLNHSSGYKNPSLYELYGADNYGYSGNRNLEQEQSKFSEENFDINLNTKSKLVLSFFENKINNLIEYTDSTYKNTSGVLKQSGIEISYELYDKFNQLTFFGSSLSSKKTNGSSQLRRPEWFGGMNYNRVISKNLELTTVYKFVGEQFDIHNSNFSTITMPEKHLLDLGITRNFYNLKVGFQINNLLNEKYESPHGFSQNDRVLNFVLKNNF